jgi:hypothetical protein
VRRDVAEGELARKAFELLLSLYTGQLTEEQHEELARGLEALLLPPPRRKRKAFIPPAAARRAGEGAEGVRKRLATGQELKEEELKGKIPVKIPVNPSLLPSSASLACKLARERGCEVKLRVVRLGDLPPLRQLSALLPPRLRALAAKAGGRVVRLELEVSR